MNKRRRKKFKIQTTFIEEDYAVKRAQYMNTLYIYVYKRSLLHYNQVLALKVNVLD